MMRAWAAREGDGRLTLFCGAQPEPVRVNLDQIYWRAGDGCMVVCNLPRDLFPDVRCGQCAEIVAAVTGDTPLVELSA
jgi:hypothetical protein